MAQSRFRHGLVLRAATVAGLGGFLLGFDTVVAEHHVGGAFGFFGLMMVLQFFFALYIMPETKGGTLEDIGKTA